MEKSIIIFRERRILMIYRELKQHGTEDFPIELYHMNKDHARFEMASHFHSQAEIILILEGELRVKLYNNEYTAKKGDVIFVNSETVHGASPSSDCIYECIVLHIELLDMKDKGCKFFIDGLLNGEYKVIEFHSAKESQLHTSVNRLFESMRELEGSTGMVSVARKFSVISNLYSTLVAIIDEKLYFAETTENISEDKNLAKLKGVLSFIRTNYDKPITLSEMSAVASMSPKGFCNFFKTMTMKTPVDYLVSYRVEKAARKLLSTDMSVTEVAYATGFNDLSYFIKTFKKLKGSTPTSYRKNR
jgi:AraC-like DNA-binding protein/quercetin dioxygenase-like cupin family protein